VLVSAAPFVFFFFQRKAEARLLREQRQYHSTLLNAAKGMVEVRDLHNLLNLIVHLLTRAMKLTHAGIFLVDERSGKYVARVCRDREILRVGLTLEADDAAIQWLREKKEPIVTEEIRQGAATQVNGVVSTADLQASLKKIEASVVVPSVVEDKLMGFLVLGDKKSGQMYSQDDLNVLQTLANQGALAIQNARFYEELQAKTAELIQTSRLTSMGKMASGIGHQFHNRLACLAAEAQNFQATVLPKLRAAQSDEERHALLDKLDATLNSISEESMKGKAVVKTLLHYAKPTTTEMHLSPVSELVQGGLNVIGLKHDVTQYAIHLNVPTDHPHLKVNLPLMNDVFFNLIDNSCDFGALQPFKKRR
jgi:two-component system NtrC family sensor kinase